MPKLLALDTETTGLDLYHDARPFFVTSCDEDGTQLYWEWEVDPYTRRVTIPDGDVADVRTLVDSADRIVFHNAKFDITALERIGVYETGEWPWEKTEDTLMGGHLLYSAESHTLDDMVTQYFGDDITPLEDAIEAVTQDARRKTRPKSFVNKFGNYKIMKPGLKGYPSSGGEVAGGKKTKKKEWKADMWLPKRVASDLHMPPDVPHWTALEEYANADSKWTVSLWIVIEEMIRDRNLWDIYRSRMAVLQPAHEIEHYGVTGLTANAEVLDERLRKERSKRLLDMKMVARNSGFDLDPPRGGNNRSLLSYVFDHLKLPVLKKTAKGNPAFDKEVIGAYVNELPPGDARTFMSSLQKKRLADTALQYIDGYKRYWKPEHRPRRYDGCVPSIFRLHPNLNPTGTVQLRWGHSNPNTANISKKKEANLRYMFGPGPDEEWWSLDYQNVELRIPTFCSGEQALIDVFLKPQDPPYFGSYHLVVFAELFPDLWAAHGLKVKDLYDDTYYQWTKNGDFAFIYGAGKKKINATFHHDQAYDIIGNRFPKIVELAEKKLWEAKKYKYVQTVPDRTVDPRRGFPIMAGRTDDGSVLPTTPLNYFVSGTAMWITGRSMVRCGEKLRQWRRDRTVNGRMVLQIHDELVFAFAKSKVDPEYDRGLERDAGGPLTDTHGSEGVDLGAYGSNLGYVRVLQRLMERGGTDLVIPVPTPVGVEYNRDNWSDITLKC